MVTGSTRGVPVHPLAWAAITTAVVAGVLALYGSMQAEKHLPDSPLRAARGDAGLPARPGTWAGRKWEQAEASAFGGDLDRKVLETTERSKVANYALQAVAYVLPFVLGVAAALAGGSAMNAVERGGGKYAGNTLSVFAMLAGGLAAVVAGCMMVSLYLWPHVPSLYTT